MADRDEAHEPTANAPEQPAGGAGAGRSAGPVLRARGLTKSFLGNVVLESADLDLVPGQVHGLVGENGAGKSSPRS